MRERREVLEVIGGDLYVFHFATLLFLSSRQLPSLIRRPIQQGRAGRSLYHFVLDPPEDCMENTTFLHSFITLERYNMLAFFSRAIMFYGRNTPKIKRTPDWFAECFIDMNGGTVDGEPDGRRVHRSDVFSALATHAFWLRKRITVGSAALVARDVWNEWCDTTIPRIRDEQRRTRRNEQGSGVFGYLKLPPGHPKRRQDQRWIIEDPGSPTNEPKSLREPDLMDLDQDVRNPSPGPARERAPSPEGNMPVPARPQVRPLSCAQINFN